MRYVNASLIDVSHTACGGCIHVVNDHVVVYSGQSFCYDLLNGVSNSLNRAMHAQKGL